MFDAVKVREACVEWICRSFRESGPRKKELIDRRHAANLFKLHPMPVFEPEETV